MCRYGRVAPDDTYYGVLRTGYFDWIFAAQKWQNLRT